MIGSVDVVVLSIAAFGVVCVIFFGIEWYKREKARHELFEYPPELSQLTKSTVGSFTNANTWNETFDVISKAYCPDYKWGTEPKKPSCAYCGNPREDNGETCHGCGSRVIA